MAIGHVRLWDKDFNLLHSAEGDISTFIGELTITVDREGEQRQVSRILEVRVVTI